jgi:hypothetical protein
LAFAWDSGVDFTGFLTVDEGAAGAVCVGAGGAVAGSCGRRVAFAAEAAANNISEGNISEDSFTDSELTVGRFSNDRNITASSVAGVVERHLAAD